MNDRNKMSALLASALVLTAWLVMSCGREGPEAPPDTLPPTINATSPYYNEPNVPLNASVKVVFNEAMSSASITDKSILLLKANTGVAGTASCKGDTAVFKPSANLSPTTLYTVRVTVEVKDLAGNAMVVPYEYSFTTGTTVSIGTHVVTASAGPNGSISPAGNISVDDGRTAAFQVRPDAGYHLVVPVGGTCGGTLSGTVYTTGPVTRNCTVAASFAADTPGDHTVTASAGAHGSISPAGAVVVAHKTAQRFTITADSGYHVVTPVGGTCGGTLSGTAFTTNVVTRDCTVAATFAADTLVYHTVTATAGPNGSIAPGSASVQDGKTYDFSVIPDSGYQIASVTGCGGTLSGTTYRTGAITGPCGIGASFQPVPPPPVTMHTIKAEADANGEIIPSGDVAVASGADQSFEIKTDGVFVISSIKVDDVEIDVPRLTKSFTYTFVNVSRDHKISARFKRFWQIDASAEGNGSISPAGMVAVEDGGSQAFNMVPGSGSTIADVVVDAYSVGSLTTYLFTNVSSNHTIWAGFSPLAPVQYTITATVTGSGSVDPPSATVDEGAIREFRLVPAAGFHVATPVGGSCGGSLAESILIYTTDPVAADCTVEVTFEADHPADTEAAILPATGDAVYYINLPVAEDAGADPGEKVASQTVRWKIERTKQR